MSEYDHHTTEHKWLRRWQESRAFSTDLQRAPNPYYNLMMFPYPSASGLHVGNLFAFVGSDIHGRFMRAQGRDVFEPFGFDAFGMHSENHAIRTGRHPRDQVPASIARFREQMQRMGTCVDWEREVDTTDPSYYRWTQWLFLKLYEAGLMYQKEAPVNWCPDCRTVLADEQAAGGHCERCGTEVTQRPMLQWFARITDYAQRLLDNLEWIDWSDVTRKTQTQWIGRSEGVEIRFEVEGEEARISTFTTRADTLWGVTFLVLAPEHPLVEQLVTPEARPAVEEYVRAVPPPGSAERRQGRGAPTGAFTGRWALHPATGQRLPVWVADYVLTDYGTGAVMAVPAHDQRDLDFARAHDLPVVRVVTPGGGEGGGSGAGAGGAIGDRAYPGPGALVDSGPFTGMASAEAAVRVGQWLAERDQGGPQVRFRLRDWCISRQRYWGPPIPIIHCPTCGTVPVPFEELPVLLPDLEDFRPDGSGQSPLARSEAFACAPCPGCGQPARRETDVSDNFLDSAWYFLRYPSTECADAPFDPERTRKWVPVDMYIGGKEHSVLHLMYTRFVMMALHDLGLVEFEEPFKRFRAHGLLLQGGAKMSKSKPNTVGPEAYVKRYGADTLRTYLMFLGPFQQGGEFSDRGMGGVRRFYERLWQYATTTRFIKGEIADRDALVMLQEQVRIVTRAIETLHYNRAVAGLMELLNRLTEARRHYAPALEVLLKMVAPFGPFMAQELWERRGHAGLVEAAGWPEADAGGAQPDAIEWVIQVNGKVRDRMELPSGAGEEEAAEAACARERVREWTDARRVDRVIVVPGRLVNVVVVEA